MNAGDLDLREIQKLQPILNIGTLGHVSHGKSTIVKQMSGKRPQQFAAEQVRNITIKLGYANAKIFKCEECDLYLTKPGKTSSVKCQKCKKDKDMTLSLHYSFVDVPGHESFMSTMLSGTAAMDAALLVIGSNEQIPQPQTEEHLVAAELMGLKHGIVVMNKLDLISKDQAKEAYTKVTEFVANTIFENSEVVPICANYGYNIDNVLARYLCEKIPIPDRQLNLPPRMVVIRSFDISKAGDKAYNVKGGVAGGSITQGVLRVGDTIEIRPGLVYQLENEETGKMELFYKPLRTQVLSLYSEKTSLQQAVAGGLIGVGTTLDPALTKQNALVGQVIGLDLPDVYSELTVKFCIIDKFKQQYPFKKGETILISVHSSEIESKVKRVLTKKTNAITVILSKPVCIEMNEKVSLSKLVNQRWRLCGFATIKKGKVIKSL